MSGIIGSIVGSGAESAPVITYLGDYFIGNRNAGQSFSTTLNIGDPHPNVRIIAYNRSDLYPSGTLNFSCSFDGTVATRSNAGGSWPEGQSITTQFNLWTGNISLWVSQQFQNGGAVNLNFNCSVSSWQGPVGFLKVVNLRSPTPIATANAASSRTINMENGAFVIFSGVSSNFGARDAPSSITNTTFRFRSSNAPASNSVAPFSGFDYQNLTGVPQTLTFTTNSGLASYYLFR
jgi:hypothetical protein